MQTIIAGIFLVLHGLVHLLYFGQSRRFFELRPKMVWPDGSWAFSRLFGDTRSSAVDETTRLLASIFLVVVAIGFVAGGIGVFIGQSWWRPLILGSAILSTVLFLLFWDGKFQALDEKGAIALLINLAIFVLILIFNWNR